MSLFSVWWMLQLRPDWGQDKQDPQRSMMGSEPERHRNLVSFITLVLQLFISAIDLAYPDRHTDVNIDLDARG